MWMIDPRILCRKHLLGEHVETHMIAGCLRLGKSLDGYINTGLVELKNLTIRHDQLAGEMLKRGMNHKSELVVSELPDLGKVNRNRSLLDLIKRCDNCLKRLVEFL
jgi:hypothetical protein